MEQQRYEAERTSLISLGKRGSSCQEAARGSYEMSGFGSILLLHRDPHNQRLAPADVPQRGGASLPVFPTLHQATDVWPCGRSCARTVFTH